MPRIASSVPNLEIIAKKLGLSRATASRAIRNVGRIHPETRRRVLEMAHSLGYVIPMPHKPADAPTKHHVMVLSQATHSSDWNYLAGMSRAATPLRLLLLVYHVSREDALDVIERQYQPLAMQEGMVDGLVFFRRWDEAIVRKLASSIPSVSVMHDYPHSSVDFLGIDNHIGMTLIVEHLVKAGYRKIGFFGYCVQMGWSRSRYFAYLEALSMAGLTSPPGSVISIELADMPPDRDPSLRTYAEAALRRTRKGIDAWVCACDHHAFELMGCLLSNGVRVPEDVGLTGFHHTKPERTTLPKLTSIETSDQELGATALRMLVHRFEFPRDPRRSLLLAPTLLEGESTRPTRAL